MASDERQTSAGYDHLAWFYDKYWGDRYHQPALAILDRLLFPALEPGSRVLDLCCGAGHLTQHIAARNFLVTGLDRSEQMLMHARKRFSGGEFLVADARHFSFLPVFQAAVSTFESLNHVLDFSDLVSVLRNVRAALQSDGVFVFDMNLEIAYLSEWNKSSALVEEDHALIVRGRYDSSNKIGETSITIFQFEKQWRRMDLSILQRCYQRAEIEKALKEAGFAEISGYQAAELGMAGEIGAGRMFFVAWKSQAKH